MVEQFKYPFRERACRACGRLRDVEIGTDDLCETCRGIRNTTLYSQKYRCQGCNKFLLIDNYRIADGCPCNSPRGVNHGLVPTLTCTCVKCDPQQTGSSRKK